MESLPSIELITITSLLSITRFENQRWIRARSQGLRGNSEVFGHFVDFTGIVSAIISWLFIVAYWYDFTFPQTGILLSTYYIAPLLWSILTPFIFKGDNINAWLIGTILTWPLMMPLIFHVSWFEFFG